MLLAQPPRPPCVPAGARIILARSAAAVFETRRSYEACSGSHRPVVLGGRLPSPGMFAMVGSFRLAGRDVGFVVDHTGPMGSPAEIRVIDLVARRVIADHQAVVAPSPQRDDEVGSFVLGPRGATAWIVRTTQAGSSAASREVNAAGPRDVVASLDRGGRVALRSLRLHGCRLTWRHGRARRSAPLPGCI